MSPSIKTESLFAADPPKGWTKDRDELLKQCYWTDRPSSLRSILRNQYGLLDAQPIWAHNPEFGTVLIIFQASPFVGGTRQYYVWNGIESTVARFEEGELYAIKSDIDTHGGGKGYLGKVKLAEISVG